MFIKTIKELCLYYAMIPETSKPSEQTKPIKGKAIAKLNVLRYHAYYQECLMTIMKNALYV